MRKRAAVLVTEDMGSDPKHRERSRAVRGQAQSLARAIGAHVDLLHVDNIEPYPIEVPVFRPMADDFRSRRRERLERMSHAGRFPMRPVFIESPVIPGILGQARPGSYRMIIVGTQGRRGLSRFLVGSVAEEIIRNSRVPVMTVGPKAQVNRPKWEQGTTLIVASDFGPNSRRAERFALELAKQLNARLRIVVGFRDTLHPILQVAEEYPTKRGEISRMLNQEYEHLRVHARNRIRRFRDAGVDCEILIDRESETASEAVVKATKDPGVAAVVMGTHGRNWVRAAFLGSTSRKTILQAPVPVITVRSR